MKVYFDPQQKGLLLICGVSMEAGQLVADN
jgi:hypothetical protein